VFISMVVLFLIPQTSPAAIMIKSLHVADASTSEMRLVQTATLIAGRGIDGDRYCSGCGTYSVMAEPGRQLTLISASSAEESLAAAGLGLHLGNLRRNVVVRGLTASQLLDAVGCELSLGSECVVFVHRSCVPCMYNERMNHCPGMMEALWETAGVNCEIVRGGLVHTGDEVKVRPETRDMARITHGKPAGFFVRPSKRGMPMVRELRDGLRSAHARLLAKDPTGCARVAAAYASVGLTFWPLARPNDSARDSTRDDTIVSRCASLAALLVPLAAVAIAVRHHFDTAAWHDEL
jgi:MOSC domain-containing protein YiiM